MKDLPVIYNVFNTVKDYHEAGRNNRILRVGLQLDTPSCNFKCPYCYVDNENIFKEDKKYNVNLIYNWIEQAYELGTRGISINGKFEPLMNKDVLEIIKFSDSKGISTLLVTNAYFLTEKLAMELMDLNVSILCKLNYPIVDIQNSKFEKYSQLQSTLFGLPNNSDIYIKTINKIRMLIDMGYNKSPEKANSNYTRLGIESVITKYNIKYLPDLIRQCRDLNIYTHVEIPKIQGVGINNQSIYCSKDEIYKFFNKVLNDDIANNYNHWEIKPPYIAGTCYQNLCRININYNGDVYPCPGVNIKVGSLLKSSLQEILYESDVLHILRNLDKNIQGDCKTCKFFKNQTCYAGCRGMAFQKIYKKEIGNLKDSLTASDPSCWRVNNIFD